MELGNKNLWGKILLIEVLIVVFLVGYLPDSWERFTYSALYTALFVTSAMNLDKYDKTFLKLSIGLVLIEWTTTLLNFPVLNAISTLLTVFFFTCIGVLLIYQIVDAKNISKRVIFEAINGYLILGIIFSLLIAVTTQIDPTSYNFTMTKNAGISDCIYYGFVTFSTLGYGDLVPLTPHAKSLALLTAISGQLYLATIIALLVGKYASQRK